VRSHYDVLGLDPASDPEVIKKAFRREIARYHPDKVSHLGPEFQAMAATKAAELTTAYTTLSNATTRAAYDAALAAGRSAVVPPPQPEPVRPAAPQAPPVPVQDAPVKPASSSVDDRSDIMRRAAINRLRAALTTAVPDGVFVSVPGFDLSMVSRAKPSLFRRTVAPSLLIRLAEVVDREVVVEAYASAMKAKIDQKPVVMLLGGDRLAPLGELAQAIDDHRRRNPGLVDVLLPVPVDIRDWSPRVPANAPAPVKDLLDALKSHMR
jgi:hypothetical protein